MHEKLIGRRKIVVGVVEGWIVKDKIQTGSEEKNKFEGGLNKTPTF